MRSDRPIMTSPEAQLRKKNIRLGLLLGGIALAFFAAVIAKHVFGL
jgi:hypothetical protein